MATKKVFSVGSKVRMTKKFLGSAGQLNSSEARRTWIILAFDGDFAIVDQEKAPGWEEYFTADELKTLPNLKWRRINLFNLQKA